MTSPLLEVRDLQKHFPIHGGIFYRQIATVHAVENVSLSVNAGQTVGLVGESGCGKSTVGRTILRLYDPTAGSVLFQGLDIAKLSKKEMRRRRRDLQIIFQDPFESLNSRHTVGHIIEEPFIIHEPSMSSKERQEKVAQLLDRVGLPENARHKFPHEFSGGQRQRIGIARAIALKPKLIVCDEPVSALDVSIQSQVLNLLLELQEEMGLAYLFIAHDLAVVKHISDRIAVMYLGHIVEFADAEQIYENPRHPYTKALTSAIPIPDPTKKSKRTILEGEVPSPILPPSGCPFHTRCPNAKDLCHQQMPVLEDLGDGHQVACHFHREID
jgi:oligopeptide/dipeptide ABC transporter ATP-binding protein